MRLKWMMRNASLTHSKHLILQPTSTQRIRRVGERGKDFIVYYSFLRDLSISYLYFFIFSDDQSILYLLHVCLFVCFSFEVGMANVCRFLSDS
jgi:hypothetical protein